MRCRHLDLDAVLSDLQFDTLGAGDATRGSHCSNDAAASLQYLYIMRAKVERCLAIGGLPGKQTDRTVVQPELALLDAHRKRAGFANEAVHEG